MAGSVGSMSFIIVSDYEEDLSFLKVTGHKGTYVRRSMVETIWTAVVFFALLQHELSVHELQHGDLNLENILINENLEPVIINFGVIQN
jgi:serine/threonine protein kinase